MKKQVEDFIIAQTFMERVQKNTGVNITAKSRFQQEVMFRHAFVYICITKLKMRVGDIADIINRDHSTVVHCSKKAKMLLEVNDELFLDFYEKALDAYRYVRFSDEQYIDTYGHTMNINDIIRGYIEQHQLDGVRLKQILSKVSYSLKPNNYA